MPKTWRATFNVNAPWHETPGKPKTIDWTGPKYSVTAAPGTSLALQVVEKMSDSPTSTFTGPSSKHGVPLAGVEALKYAAYLAGGLGVGSLIVWFAKTELTPVHELVMR